MTTPKHADIDCEQLARHAETATHVRYRNTVHNLQQTAQIGLDLGTTPVSGDMLTTIAKQGVVGVLRRRPIMHRTETDR